MLKLDNGKNLENSASKERNISKIVLILLSIFGSSVMTDISISVPIAFFDRRHSIDA
jgi:hypothetical protein